MVILHVPDLHIPFHNQGALKFVCKLRDKYKPHKIIFGGDVFDQYSMSRYAKDPDALSASKEFELASKEIKKWIKEFPRVNITTGNHDIRLMKRLGEIGIPFELIGMKYNELWGLPNTWYWHEQIEENNIIFMHGSKTGPCAHIETAKAFRQNTVICHTHANAGVHWLTGPKDSIFAVNSGCLIDGDSMAFNYAKDMYQKPVLGATVITGNQPQFIHFEE